MARDPVQTKTVMFRGGLDLISQGIAVPPGRMIACQNYEVSSEGYERGGAYERFDGQHKPSETTYAGLSFDAGQNEPSVGETITGDSSSATGILVEAVTLDSGSWAGNDAAGTMILRNLSGTFVDDEGLSVGMTSTATADGTQDTAYGSTQSERDGYQAAAVAAARADISAVPGSGDVRGVVTYKGDVYAFRDNAGGTAIDMHKATSSGWSAQSFGRVLDFTSGGSAVTVEEGDAIEGATSGATATVERVVLESGSWAAGDAAGYFVLSGQSGTFQSENIDDTTEGGSNDATIGGDSSAITIAAGGRVRWTTHNFFGASNLFRLYFATGEDTAYEWDGSVLTPIRTGLSTALDKPKYIGVLSNHLVLGYDGGHLQYSATGEPLSYLVSGGAGTLSVGQDLTGISDATKGALIVTTTNRVGYMSGSDSNDFAFEFISEDSGGIADTLHVVGEPYYLDDRGIRALSAAEQYGNWTMGTASTAIEPLLKSKNGRQNTVGAMRVREKDQYRVVYSDGAVIVLYFGRGQPEPSVLSYGFTPTCLASGTDSNGGELLFAGADDGFVYQLDVGKSQDGSVITAYLRTSFMHQGAPQRIKRYHWADFEISGASGGSGVSLASDFGYGNQSKGETDADVFGSGGFWNEANWNEFTWSNLLYEDAKLRLNGIGENVSLVLSSEASDEGDHLLSSVTIGFSLRKLKR